MADGADDPSVHWVEPRLRAILPLDGFHLSRSLKKVIVSDHFRVTTDTAFADMVALCAEPAGDRPTTWINPVIKASYDRLFQIGHAHSVECWQGDELVGGLYGVSLGRAFFGESMVSRARDAGENASIRSQYVAYQELKGLRGEAPDEDGFDGIDQFLGKLTRVTAFDLAQERIECFSAFRFLYERLLGARARPYLPAAFCAAAALPSSRPERRKLLLQSCIPLQAIALTVMSF